MTPPEYAWPDTPAADPVTALQAAVEALGKAMPALLEACTDPEATDMGQLLLEVREAREQVYGLERDVEAALARAMMADDAASPTLRMERYRSRDRKEWDHDGWKRDARAKVLRSTGLLAAAAVITKDGEELPVRVLWDALEATQAVHGSAAPKVTALRKLGLDASDYCRTEPGTQHVRVYRLADETEGAE